ncbi:MAG: MoaD/ThiS family protein [Phycisphaerales bacterium]|nr:MoaD/ThiS family protein [Phycisphaerales bacterium]
MSAKGNITVVALASAADVCGFTEQSHVVGPSSTVETVIADLERAAPRLAAVRARLRFAINGEYADTRAPLQSGDELAIIPPVSGG